MFRIVSCLGVATLVLVPAPADAKPPGAACPVPSSGFVLWDVETEPYGVDNLVDQAGNGDGLVCAMPIYVELDENGEPFQVYNFIDNRVVSR